MYSVTTHSWQWIHNIGNTHFTGNFICTLCDFFLAWRSTSATKEVKYIWGKLILLGYEKDQSSTLIGYSDHCYHQCISNGCIQYLNLHQFSPPVTWCWSRRTVDLEATDLLVTSPVIANLPGEREISWKSTHIRRTLNCISNRDESWGHTPATENTHCKISSLELNN